MDRPACPEKQRRLAQPQKQFASRVEHPKLGFRACQEPLLFQFRPRDLRHWMALRPVVVLAAAAPSAIAFALFAAVAAGPSTAIFRGRLETAAGWKSAAARASIPESPYAARGSIAAVKATRSTV